MSVGPPPSHLPSDEALQDKPGRGHDAIPTSLARSPGTPPSGSSAATAFPSLEALRVGTDLGSLGIREQLNTVPVRRPRPQEFFRVHPDADYRLATSVVELQEEREFYLVDPSLREALAAELCFVQLYTCVTRDGSVSLWPAKIPGPEGRRVLWHESAAEAARAAMKHWVRIASDPARGCYRTVVAEGNFGDPEWPNVKFKELLELAFRDRYINSAGHAVVRRLRGSL